MRYFLTSDGKLIFVAIDTGNLPKEAILKYFLATKNVKIYRNDYMSHKGDYTLC